MKIKPFILFSIRLSLLSFFPVKQKYYVTFSTVFTPPSASTNTGNRLKPKTGKPLPGPLDGCALKREQRTDFWSRFITFPFPNFKILEDIFLSLIGWGVWGDLPEPAHPSIPGVHGGNIGGGKHHSGAQEGAV